MRKTISILALIALTSGGSLAFAQAPAKPKPATPAKKPPSKVTGVVKKLVDTAATAVAGKVVDSALGEKGRAVANALAGTSAAACPAGSIAIPTTEAAAMALAGGTGATPSAGAAVVGAAKQALKSKAANATQAAIGVAASGKVAGVLCQPIPAEAGAAGMAAGMAGLAAPGTPGAMPGIPGGMGALAAVTPVGMAVAAAPMAGKAVKGLKGMFGGKPMDKIGMLRELGKGRLELKGVKFIEGTAEMEPGFEATFATVGEALGLAEGTYLVHVAAEAAKGAEPDTALARKRLGKVWAALLVNGVSDQRVIATAVLPAELQADRKPPKPGDARVELFRFTGKP